MLYKVKFLQKLKKKKHFWTPKKMNREDLSRQQELRNSIFKFRQTFHITNISRGSTKKKKCIFLLICVHLYYHLLFAIVSLKLVI